MKFFSPKSIAVIVLLISGCGGGSGGSSAPAQATPTAIPITSPTVRASITGGTFSTVQTVELTASNGANVFFTTDSTTPNNSSTSYSGPIAISTDTVLSFIAIGSTGQSSQVIRETYLIDTLAPMNHALTSATAVVSTDNQSNFSLSIENGETGSTYRIVIDDADPNTSEIVRTGRIVISFATTIQVDLSNLANGQLFASLVLSDDAGNSSTSFSLELNKTGSLGRARSLQQLYTVFPQTFTSAFVY